MVGRATDDVHPIFTERGSCSLLGRGGFAIDGSCVIIQTYRCRARYLCGINWVDCGWTVSCVVLSDIAWLRRNTFSQVHLLVFLMSIDNLRLSDWLRLQRLWNYVGGFTGYLLGMLRLLHHSCWQRHLINLQLLNLEIFLLLTSIFKRQRRTNPLTRFAKVWNSIKSQSATDK